MPGGILMLFNDRSPGDSNMAHARHAARLVCDGVVTFAVHTHTHELCRAVVALEQCAHLVGLGENRLSKSAVR